MFSAGGMGGAGYFGVDPAALARLASACAGTNAELMGLRGEMQSHLQSANVYSSAPTTLRVAEVWLEEQGLDVLRRAAAVAGDLSAIMAMFGPMALLDPLLPALKGFWGSDARKGLTELLGAGMQGKNIVSSWKLIMAENLYRTVVLPAVARYGADSVQATNAWFRWQQSVSDLGAPVNKALLNAGLRNADEVVELSTFGRLSRVAARVLGPVGVVLDARAFVEGSPYDGARGTVDQTLTGLSVPAGMVMTAAAFGVAVPGAGLVIAGGILLVAGAWAVGNLIVDNWDGIKEGVANAGRWVEDQAREAVEEFNEFAQETREDIDRVVNAASDAVDKLDAAKDEVLQQAGETFDHVTSEVGEFADDVVAEGQELVDDALETGGEVVDDVKDKAEELLDDVTPW